MPEVKIPPRYNLGDKVQLNFGARLVGMVAEVSCVRDRTGLRLYRVHVPMEPEPLWLLVSEDEIEPAAK